MDKHRQTQSPIRPDLLVKDALRGLRFAVRKGSEIIASGENTALPRPISETASRFVRRADELCQELESLSSQTLGGPFKKNRMPESSFFGRTGFTGDGDVVEAAGALYAGLSFAAGKLGKNNPLLSEFFCAEALRAHLDRVSRSPQLSQAERASDLFSLVISRGVFRNFSALQPNDVHSGKKIMVVASFAVALWFFASRDAEITGEQDLLESCCQIAAGEMEKIFDNRMDSSAMTELFAYYLDIL